MIEWWQNLHDIQFLYEFSEYNNIFIFNIINKDKIIFYLLFFKYFIKLEKNGFHFMNWVIFNLIHNFIKWMGHIYIYIYIITNIISNTFLTSHVRYCFLWTSLHMIRIMSGFFIIRIVLFWLPGIINILNNKYFGWLRDMHLLI